MFWHLIRSHVRDLLADLALEAHWRTCDGCPACAAIEEAATDAPTEPDPPVKAFGAMHLARCRCGACERVEDGAVN